MLLSNVTITFQLKCSCQSEPVVCTSCWFCCSWITLLFCRVKPKHCPGCCFMARLPRICDGCKGTYTSRAWGGRGIWVAVKPLDWKLSAALITLITSSIQTSLCQHVWTYIYKWKQLFQCEQLRHYIRIYLYIHWSWSSHKDSDIPSNWTSINQIPKKYREFIFYKSS